MVSIIPYKKIKNILFTYGNAPIDAIDERTTGTISNETPQYSLHVHDVDTRLLLDYIKARPPPLFYNDQIDQLTQHCDRTHPTIPHCCRQITGSAILIVRQFTPNYIPLTIPWVVFSGGKRPMNPSAPLSTTTNALYPRFHVTYAILSRHPGWNVLETNKLLEDDLRTGSANY